MSYDTKSVGDTLSWAFSATPDDRDLLAARQQRDRVVDAVAELHVGVADDRLVVGGREATVDHRGRRADPVAVGTEHVADQRRVERLAVGVAARQAGERALTDGAGLAGAGSGEDVGLHVGGDHAALQHALAVDAVDEHRCVLLADRADEAGDQPVLQRLLEQDEEHQQRDRGDQQREAHLGAGHFLESEKHRRGDLAAGR